MTPEPEGPTPPADRPAAASRAKAKRVRKPAAAKKPAPPRAAAKRKGGRPPARRASAGAGVALAALAARASEVGSRLGELTGEGAAATRQAFRSVSAQSRQALQQVTRKWQSLPPRRRAEIVVAVLGALAAAAAPFVQRKVGGRAKK
jgi:hypothetical protein